MEIILGIIFVVILATVFFSRKPKAVAGTVVESAPVVVEPTPAPVVVEAPVVAQEETVAEAPVKKTRKTAATKAKPAATKAKAKPAVKKTARSRKA